MSKAWSFFWLVIAWTIAFTIIASVIAPHLGVIALIVGVALSIYGAVRIRRRINDRRTHY